jgi:hypothetical protein
MNVAAHTESRNSYTTKIAGETPGAVGPQDGYSVRQVLAIAETLRANGLGHVESPRAALHR